MAVAGWTVWREGRSRVAVLLFLLQLALNAAWPWLFFGLHRLDWAFFDAAALWVTLAATMVVVLPPAPPGRAPPRPVPRLGDLRRPPQLCHVAAEPAEPSVTPVPTIAVTESSKGTPGAWSPAATREHDDDRPNHARGPAGLALVATAAHPGEIRGRVLVDGEATPGVTVSVLPFEDGEQRARREARDEEGPHPLVETVTGKDGSFSTTLAVDGETPVRLAFTGEATPTCLLERLVDPAGDDVGDARLGAASPLAGRVLDERGGPVVGATVRLWAGRGGVFGERPDGGRAPAADRHHRTRRVVPLRGRGGERQPVPRGGPRPGHRRAHRHARRRSSPARSSSVSAR